MIRLVVKIRSSLSDPTSNFITVGTSPTTVSDGDTTGLTYTYKGTFFG